MLTVPNIIVGVVDDHSLVREGMINLIHCFKGFDVRFNANNGQELIEQIEKAVVKPDICIVDINMPVMNGYDTLKALKQRWPQIKVLILTMIENEYAIIKMLTGGASGYMLKGGNTKELEIALRTIYDTGEYDSELSHHAKCIINNEEKLHNITNREIEFLKLCCSDLTYQEIADGMKISPRTVDGLRETLFNKLNVKSRTGLALFAIKSGFTSGL